MIGIKELGLHSNVKEGTKITYFTTCGWMMWNWLVSSLFFAAEVFLYEGSPSHPSLVHFMENIQNQEIQIMGTSPKFLKALEPLAEKLPKSFPALNSILSTGAPLMPEQFDFIYQHIKKDVQVASISGGTDIIGCFMLGNPCLPVYQGEIQCLGLGMDVAAYDTKGKAIIDQEGELVCRTPFPNQPLGFWNDSEQALFRKAYFSSFKDTWTHGDFIRISSKGTVRMFGRSDATLNPGGVRIGTAEIYRETEKLPFIEDSLCVGLQNGQDVELALFVKMAHSKTLHPEQIQKIKQSIRNNTTPRHVPQHIRQVQAIPYTKNGKKMELLVTHLLNGRSLQNLNVLANPECLEEYTTVLSNCKKSYMEGTSA